VSLSKIRLRTTYVNWSVCGRADATSLGHAPHPIPSGRRCVTLLANAGTRASGPQGRACHLVGWGKGNPGFPFPQPPLATPGAPSGRGAVRQAHRRWGTPGSPFPNRRWGHLASPQAGARFDRLTAGGEPRFPLSPTAGGSGWHPHRQGYGEPRVPHSLTAVGGAWRPHRQGCSSTGSPQVGNPGFPVCSHQCIGPAEEGTALQKGCYNSSKRVGLPEGRLFTLLPGARAACPHEPGCG